MTLASRPGSKVLDHKWLDPKCIEEGCQSLVLKSIYESAVKGRQDFRAAFKAERERASALVVKIETLFDAIKHGDEKHQQWLKEKIDAHFAETTQCTSRIPPASAAAPGRTSPR